MRFSTISLATVLGAALSAALPTELTNFLLVTTADSNPNTNTSNLKAVSATSLFRPQNQPALILRLIGPGYGSLPNFTLADGTLSTLSSWPQRILYNSSRVQAGQELEFVASKQEQGNVALDEGYLLTVDGEREGWEICDGPLGTEVLYWKGGAVGCERTFVHAVSRAPY